MRNIVIGTAGHIDHGKSTLVKALTGIDPDRLKDEKERGITIDLGFAYFQQDDLNFAFVDVPGHERFIRNMLAGTSGIDCVLLVIAADESVMPQTREHFDICSLLGIDCGLIVVSKRDRVDSETLELVQLEVSEFVADSFFENAPIVPISAVTGEGIEELKIELQRIAKKLGKRRVGGITRLPIDRAFSMKGFGTVVTGTQVSGELNVGMELEVLPLGRKVRIRGLQVHGNKHKTSSAGQRVAVNLSGIEVKELSRGDTLVACAGLESTNCFDAKLRMLPRAQPLKHGARVRCHQGTAEVMARVSLSSLTENGLNSERFLNALEPGTEAYVRMRLEKPIALTRGDRFVLRMSSPLITIAGGMVLDPAPPRRRFRSDLGVNRLRRLNHASGMEETIVVMVNETGPRGLQELILLRRIGISSEEFDPLLKHLLASDRIAKIGELLVSLVHLNAVRDDLVQLVKDFHKNNRLEVGLSYSETRERLIRRVASSVFDRVIANLETDGTLLVTDRLSLISHKIEFSLEELKIYKRIEQLFQVKGLTPPDMDSLRVLMEVDQDLIDQIINILLLRGRLVKASKFIFHCETLNHLKDQVLSLKMESASPVEIDIAEFKKKFRVSRKYAIPLLGYLDGEGITRRVGNIRVVL